MPSLTPPAPTAAIRTDEDLVAPFFEACKPASEWRVGTEAEKFGVDAKGAPARFTGDRGIARMLDSIREKGGWKPYREHDGAPIIALERNGASITLEPGAQLELSGAPLATIHDTYEEMHAHIADVREAAAPLRLEFIAAGMHPFAKREDFEWVPKLRYAVMRRYLPTRGGHALDMMLRTSTVQSNLDYASEEDAMRRMRATLFTAPIVTALFANSPFVEGALVPERSYRSRVWLDVDPDRTGLVEPLWNPRATFRDYVNWALDVPMFLVKRGAKVFDNSGQTFRAFLKDGFDGERATRADWETHLNTLFPEVRLKKTIELRSADGHGSLDMLVALPALSVGAYYDDDALAKLEAYAFEVGHAETWRAREAVPRGGLETMLGGRTIRSWAEELLDLARAGLARRNRRDAKGRNEVRYLAPLVEIVDRGKTKSDLLRDAHARAKPTPESVLPFLELR